MKNLFVLFLLAFSFALNAQTASATIKNTQTTTNASKRVTSYNNAWIGSTLSYNVSGDVSDAFLLKGRALYVIKRGANYAIPIMANVALNQADSLDDSGVILGLYPYYKLAEGDGMSLVAHSGLAYQMADLQDVNAERKFRFLIGLEAAVQGENENMPPFTFSAALEYKMNIREIENQTWGIGLSGVIPVQPGLGLLVEGSIPFDNENYSTGVELGFIVNGELFKK